MDTRLQDLVDWIRRSASLAHGLLLPVSGGSDSALCFWLCAQAYPEKTMAVYCGDQLRCQHWFAQQGHLQLVPAPPDSQHREAQRWAHFLAMGLTENRWLVGARTRTEEVFGTYSLASRLATYLPIAGVWKTEVMHLCDLVGVPEEITASSRRADPDCGRPTELAEIPLELIDVFLQVKVGELPEQALSGLTSAQQAYLSLTYDRNQFKAGLPVRGPVGTRATHSV